MKLSDIKLNSKNPRIIKDDKFKSLVKSIKEFPKMMEMRPIIIDENNIVLGGNMRLKALKELGYKEVPKEWVKKFNELTDKEKNEFIVKDNIGFGEWDFELLANNFELDDLNNWGMNVDDLGFVIHDLDIPEFEEKTFTVTFKIFINAEDANNYEQELRKLQSTFPTQIIQRQ